MIYMQIDQKNNISMESCPVFREGTKTVFTSMRNVLNFSM